jgi:hypothetical protein
MGTALKQEQIHAIKNALKSRHTQRLNRRTSPKKQRSEYKEFPVFTGKGGIQRCNRTQFHTRICEQIIAHYEGESVKRSQMKVKQM